MPIRRITLLAAVTAFLGALAAGAAVAAGVPGPPALSATVDGGRLDSPRVLVARGTLTCAKKS